MSTILLPISAVKIGQRTRTVYNNIEELATSISEQGLIHPPTIDKDYNLIAGGRRMQALLLLSKEEHGQWREVEFNVMEGEVTPSRLRRLEIEENSQREDITWVEKMLGIDEYHRSLQAEARVEGDTWGQRATGDMLRVAQTSVSFAQTFAKLHRANPKDPVFACENMSDALQIVTQRKLDEATKLRLSKLQETRAALAKADSKLAVSGATMELVSGLKRAAAQPGGQAADSQTTNPNPDSGTGLTLTTYSKPPQKKELVSYEAVTNFYHIGDCLEMLPRLAERMTLHHIICDPPYAIDMDTLVSETGRVEEEHEVEPNILLIKNFLTCAYDVVDKSGFVCLWYAPEHYELIVSHASWLGFKVCLWPFVWCKSGANQNRAAAQNITKATEFCLFLRRSTSSILVTKQSKNYLECPSVTSATHPFVKPFPVWKYLIDSVSQEGQNLVDPFAGEGSALAAMFRLGRTPIGVEKVEAHAANGMSFLHTELNKLDIPSTVSPFDEL